MLPRKDLGFVSLVYAHFGSSELFVHEPLRISTRKQGVSSVGGEIVLVSMPSERLALPSNGEAYTPKRGGSVMNRMPSCSMWK